MAEASSSSESPAPTTVATPSPKRLKTLRVGETCSYHSVDSHGCHALRSCTSCLEISGCMINDFGKCVNVRDERIDPSKSYTNAITGKLVVVNATMAQRPRMRATQTWQFRAGDVRYCSPEDATCETCTRANFWRLNTSLPDSRFCLGDDGACVCVDVCERRWYVPETDCGNTSSLPSLSHVTDSISTSLWKGLAAMVAITVLVIVILIRRRCAAERVFLGQQAEARHARRHARSRELGVNILSLTGWEKHRRDLMEKEITRVAMTEEETKTESTQVDNIQSTHAVDDTSMVYARMEETPASRPPIALSFSRYNVSTPAQHTLQRLTTDPRPTI